MLMEIPEFLKKILGRVALKAVLKRGIRQKAEVKETDPSANS